VTGNTHIAHAYLDNMSSQMNIYLYTNKRVWHAVSVLIYDYVENPAQSEQ